MRLPAPPPPAPFVVGVPRSGTTLLRLMLDAHPELAIPPETHFVPAALIAARDSRSPAEAFCDVVVAAERWPDFRLEEAPLRERVEALRPFDGGEALRCFYRLYADRFGKARWGDKTPSYLGFMTPLAGLLPEARFVHIIRDGRDVACSVVPLDWGPASIAAAATRWKGNIERARAAAPGLPGYVEVRYEELVRRPEDTLRRVCAAIELPYDPRMLDYHRGAERRMAEMEGTLLDADGRPVAASHERRALHLLTRSPPRADRIERWRVDLDAAQRAAYEAIAGDLLADLGYPMD